LPVGVGGTVEPPDADTWPSDDAVTVWPHESWPLAVMTHVLPAVTVVGMTTGWLKCPLASVVAVTVAVPHTFSVTDEFG
jgi:hypothetical protein